MKNWEQKLDEFLRFNERQILPNSGKVSKKYAEVYAQSEYAKFEVRRRKFKETLGETEAMLELEKTAKQLTTGKSRKKSEK